MTSTAPDAAPTTDTKVVKAYLTITPVNADGSSVGGPRTLTLRFNPTEYRVAKSAEWHRKAAPASGTTGPLQWRGAGPRQMTLAAFLDASDSPSGSVLQDTETLLSCCVPSEASIGQEKPSPPRLTFGWGATTGFTAVLRNVDVTYMLFRTDGTPCRAKVTLTLEEVQTAQPKQNPTSGAESVTRAHTVTAGDRLPLIAFRMYGDAGKWRLIADANGLDDPLVLRPGDTLLIPARGVP